MGSTGLQTSESLVVFDVDGRRFGLGVSSVQRVLRAVALTPLPGAPDVVLGLVNVRGAVVPVFNVRRRLGIPEREIRPSDHLLVVQAGPRTVALLVDAVRHAVAWEGTGAVAANTLLPGLEHAASGQGIEGVVKLDGGIVYIYDVAKFLSMEEAASLDSALAPA